MTLISANDLHTLSAAHRARKPLALTRTLGDTAVTVRTLPAGEAWGESYLVQIRVERGHRTDIQTFESVEALRRALCEMKDFPADSRICEGCEKKKEDGEKAWRGYTPVRTGAGVRRKSCS